MDIGNALRRTGRDSITLQSVISATIQESREYDINIISVSLRGKKIIIKTGNPMINAELQLLEGDIKKTSQKRLEKLGLTLPKECVFQFI